jgi:hypothetical protein
MWKTYAIKVIYTFGKPVGIWQTVKARNQTEAERKALSIIRGKCLGFTVTLQ